MLSRQFRSISGVVGLDVTLRLHQLMAQSALVLAPFHLFLYSLPMADPMVWDIDRAHSITSDLPSLAGGIVLGFHYPRWCCWLQRAVSWSIPLKLDGLVALVFDFADDLQQKLALLGTPIPSEFLAMVP